MTGPVGVALCEGAELLLDGQWRRVARQGISASADGTWAIHLTCPDGAVESVPLAELLTREVRPAASGRQNSGLAGPPAQARAAGSPPIKERQQEQLSLRLAHVLEVETGYRSGDPAVRLPGEPRPEYDPERVPSVTARRLAKAEEVAAMRRTLGEDAARRAGLVGLSVTSQKRMAASWHRTHSLARIADGRWTRPRSGFRVTEDVRELLFEVEERHSAASSKVSLATRLRWLHLRAAEKHVPAKDLPGRETYRKIRKEWFGSGRARQRYRRTDAAIPDQMVSVKPTRPGQLVMLDTSDWDAKLRDGLFGDPVTAKLTLAVDVYTRSIVGFRFMLTSDKSVDVAMVLRDVIMPLPMRAGWPSDAEWPYPGVPSAVLAEGLDYTVAGKPFFLPETITTDHGAVYANHHVREIAEYSGISLLPARKMRGRDKNVVEAMFRVIRQLLVEHLPGWRGVDVADRGADPEADAVMTVDQAHEYLAWFVVNIWQRRELGEYKPGFAPTGPQSPNSIFALAMAQGGWLWQLPDPQLYYLLLQSSTVRVTGRGVRVRGLWYRDAADPTGLGALTDPAVAEGRPAAQSHSVTVRWDPRDRRHVYTQHPRTGEWHELRWTGLPPDDEFPAFSDVTAQAILEVAASQGIRPRTDAELLPLFYERWRAVEDAHGAAGKRQRQQRAREVAQARAAGDDRAQAAAPVNAPPDHAQQPTADAMAASVAGRAADAARAHARQQGQEGQPAPARLMRDRIRTRSHLTVVRGEQP